MLRRLPPSTTASVWAALVLAPVLFLVETTGPRWLNLALRGLWVALVGVVAVQVTLARRRTTAAITSPSEVAR